MLIFPFIDVRFCSFIISMFQVDRLYAWKAQRNAPIRKALKQQSKDVQNEFDRRLIEVIYYFCFLQFYQFAPFVKTLPSTGSQVITQFKEQGLNTELYYKNKDMGETFNIVPTSAIT